MRPLLRSFGDDIDPFPRGKWTRPCGLCHEGFPARAEEPPTHGAEAPGPNQVGLWTFDP
jgi:hypothetical protein